MIQFSAQTKLYSPEKLMHQVSIWRFLGDTIVFTNGCFDILHVGHLHSLIEARKLGKRLIVGLNSDASVKKLKGEFRPIHSENDRALMLAALMCVDAVVVFEEETATSLIELVKPEIYAKGGDYQPETLPEYPAVMQNGGKVVIIPFVAGHSTTQIIQTLSGKSLT